MSMTVLFRSKKDEDSSKTSSFKVKERVYKWNNSVEF